MPTYQTIIDLALQQALAGGDQLKSALLDADMTVESFVTNVFQNVALKFAADEEGRSLLRRTHSITLTNGVGVVPDEVLTQCKRGASIADPDDLTVAQLQSFVPYWSDFVQPRSGLQADIPWWTIKGSQEFFYIESGADYDPLSGFTGNLELTIATVPTVPALSTDDVDVPDELISDLLSGLSLAIRNIVRIGATGKGA